MAAEALSAKPENQNKPGVTVVTNENINEFVAKQTGKEPAKEAPAADSPEAKAAAEHAKVEAEKAERLKAAKDADGEEIDHPDEKKKSKLNERFADLTAKRKAAEEAAAKAAADAKAAREARDKAEQDAAALRSKYEPPKSDELGPEPQVAQFTDVNEYAKALKDWTAEKTLQDKAKKDTEERQAKERETAAAEWAKRQSAFKAETTDYEKMIGESDVKVSDQVRDAIIDSDVGPQILYHLAQHPEEAQKIAGLTVAGALRAIGRLEAAISGGKSSEKTVEAKTPIVEISKAPAPITPLKGASAPVVSLTGSDDVPKSMSYEDWKALRKAGKIK